jgi:hypothetical protein
MSSATVRQTIQTFFAGSTIPGVHKVYRAQPWFIDGEQWQLDTQLGSGSVAFVHLNNDSDTRITLPAPNTLNGPVGNKAVRYDVGLVLLYQYLIPSSLLTAVPEDDWTNPLDATIDGVKDAIRSAPNLGDATVIFQAGQDPDGLRITRDLPRLDNGKVLSWNVVEFTVLEIITA